MERVLRDGTKVWLVMEMSLRKGEEVTMQKSGWEVERVMGEVREMERRVRGGEENGRGERGEGRKGVGEEQCTRAWW